MVEFLSEDLELLKKKPAKKDGTTILQHTHEVLNVANTFLQIAPPFINKLDEALLLLAVKYHDYGKLNKEFENLMHGSNLTQTMYHHLISPLYFLDREKSLDRLSKLIITISIIYHHARQRSLLSIHGFKLIIESLNKLYNEKKLPGVFDFKKAISVYELLLGVYLHNRNKYLNKRIELLSGYLMKIDHASSGGIPVELPSISERREVLFLGAVGSNSLNKVQIITKDNRESLCLIADTGSGKTGAGVVWSKRKMMYVLPVRTSVNAMYRTLSKIYGKDRVGLLHSTALFHLLKEDDDPLMTYDNSRNLSMPVTVTTADQLFVSAYKFPTYEKIYSTLSYSDIVIDEIQGFAPEQLVPILHVIEETKELGARCLIMTATLPRFLREKFREELCIHAVEAEPDPVKRHLIRLHESTIYTLCEEIIDKGKSYKVLVIVNTIRKAKQLYRELRGVVNAKLLHSRFILKHRDELEKNIIDDYKGSSPTVWITTQLVEASLDISYDFLYTEIATIDALIQRMGRIYRHQINDYSGEPNIVIALKSDDSVYDKDIVSLTIKAISDFNSKYMTSEDKRKTVDEIYSEENLKKTQYWKKWEETEGKLGNPIIQEVIRASGKGDAQDLFRYVPGINAIPMSIYNSDLEEIETSLKTIKEEM